MYFMSDRKQTQQNSLRPSDTSLYEGGRKAFTLVELIVVVTILAILATIGFVSYSSYLTGVRDTNRLAQLVSIHD
jgi:prepilin-type N-terminal cleavage/methylation domain-containing protein